MSTSLVWDILNWQTMVIELSIGIIFAIGLFWLQHRTSRDMRKMTETIHRYIIQKTEFEYKYKAAQCEVIIELLKDIQEKEKVVKEILNSLQMGTPMDQWSKFLLDVSVRPIKYKIIKMSETIGKLQAKLNDFTLEKEFSEYLGWFDLLPKRIFVDNLTDKMTEAGQEHLIKGLVIEIDKQMEKIQTFLDRFSKETEISLAQEHEEDRSGDPEILNHRKYFNAPKL